MVRVLLPDRCARPGVRGPSTGDGQLASVCGYLYAKVLQTDQIESFFNALTHVTVRELSGGDPGWILCGITSVRSRRAGTAASSSSLEAQERDEVQYGLGEGP